MGRASGAEREARPGNTNARPRGSYEIQGPHRRHVVRKLGLSARKPCRRRLAKTSTSAISSPPIPKASALRRLSRRQPEAEVGGLALCGTAIA
jgi:hypothetical protein